MKLSRLIESIGPISVRGKVGVEVKGITAHSRQVEEGFLFVALPGERFNGADFICEAKDRGAVGLVVKDFTEVLNHDLAQVKVGNPRKALALLANEFFGHPDREMRILGITGTNGKTTVSVLAHAILEAAGISTGLLGTLSYRIKGRSLPAGLTTPAPPRLQLLLREMKKAGCSHVIMEVSSHALEQERVAGIEFRTALFTNLSREHLDYHRTLVDYQRAKLKLFENLHRGKDGASGKIAVLNYDQPLTPAIRELSQTAVLTYGRGEGADLRAGEVRLSREGSSFHLFWRGASYPARIALPGEHNIYNALAAVALALTEGVPPEKALAFLAKVPRVPGRLEAVNAGQDFTVLVDYAHTPDALEKILGAIREVYQSRIILVFGCGGDRDKSKRPLMARVAQERADEIVVTSDNPRSEEPEKIIEDILEGFSGERKRVQAVTDRRSAIATALSRAGSGDVVVIAGKGHEQEQIFRDRIVLFDDRDVALEILKHGRADFKNNFEVDKRQVAPGRSRSPGDGCQH